MLNKGLLDDAVAALSKTHKTLSPKWLYDDRGSALFEQITSLPEYYLTRTEADILRRNANTLAALVPDGGALVELGSGASVKTRYLLDAGTHFGTYVPIDISADFLHRTADALRLRYPDLKIAPQIGDFLAPLDLPLEISAAPKVGFFPGSTIGNLDPAAAQTLLRNARAWPAVEGFVLGVDLVKDTDELVAAYDAAAGVKADFITNILVRLNREAGANFDLDAFRYEAAWNSDAARIDMRLISSTDQTVDLPGARIAFAAEEPIHVSASRKYTLDSLTALATSAGWHLEETWTDADIRFAVAALRPA